MVRFIQQLQPKAPEVQKENRAEEGYSTNEELDSVLVMLCYLFHCLALTMLLGLFRVPDTSTVPKNVTI